MDSKDLVNLISDLDYGQTVIVSSPEPEIGNCEFCGIKSFIRPLGKDNEKICFNCAERDVVTSVSKMFSDLNAPFITKTNDN